MNTAIIMLGSNVDAEQNLELAKEKISEYYEVVSESSILKNTPRGAQYKNEFSNQALKVLSADNAEETKYIFKQIESDMGRTEKSKSTGQMPIDIDLIFWNETQLHKDYSRFEYVKTCVNEII